LVCDEAAALPVDEALELPVCLAVAEEPVWLPVPLEAAPDDDDPEPAVGVGRPAKATELVMGTQLLEAGTLAVKGMEVIGPSDSAGCL